MTDKLSVKKMRAWNKGAEYSSHFRIPTFVFVGVGQLEQRVEMTERALYNAINEGVAHAFLNLDDDSRRARVMTQEEVVAEEKALEQT